jgi:selenium-binding protein 1
MRRRDFLSTSAAATAAAAVSGRWWAQVKAATDAAPAHACGPGFANPQEAQQAAPEKLLYTIALYGGTGTKQPDYLATIDTDPASPTYSKIIHRLKMPYVDDELHHFGWNTCSSCHADHNQKRQYLVIPGLRSSRIYIVDVSTERTPKLHQVIEPEEIRRKTNLSAPHTVHCLPSGQIMISMLGDAQGNGPGGFLLLNDQFQVAGRWEQGAEGMRYNYDFWYQPRHNVMVSSEWGAPKTFSKGFDPQDVAQGRYGTQIHFWDWKKRAIAHTHDLGESGRIPLEVRFHHNPDSTHGFVGAALSSTMWHWHQQDDQWQVEKVIDVEPVDVGGKPLPGLITDLLISMDDRWLYFSNWLHGDLRQYDISDPSRPKLTGQLWCGGLLGKRKTFQGHQLEGGPQMLQMSLDGRRLYVSSSLFSAWDNQFYPEMTNQGSYLMQIDCDPEQGGMKINEDFFVDFGKEPDGPSRAHEMRYPGGDCTSDIFV